MLLDRRVLDVSSTRNSTVSSANANRLFCGDNLDVLRKEIAAESVDLIYLDPPFKSDQNFNIIYREKDGRKATAQQRAFEDTWEWNQTAKDTYQQVIEQGGRIADALRAFYSFLGPMPMMAYLAMMAPRLAELHRVLKSTGSLYLHCDPNASHYLKILLDGVFGTANFKNEIIWKRTVPKSDFSQGATNWPRVHDVLLYYVKDENKTAFQQPFTSYSQEYIGSHYRQQDPDGRHYQLTSLIAPGAGTRGHPKYEFMGVTRYWRYNIDKMKGLAQQGRVVQPSPRAVPRYKRYLDEMAGVPVGDIWEDIRPINSQAQERLGYPTQKPEKLLERILRASSQEGDVVLDPFCGCGTAVAVSQRLNRRWVGIDIAKLAIGVIRGRLHNQGIDSGYEAKWLPTTADEASALAEEDPFGFQCWVLGELGINPLYQKRGADRGIDGRMFFFDGPNTSKPQQIIYSVKGGKLSPAFVRELEGVVRRERAQIGVLVTLEEPTAAMRKEAATADHYRSHDDSLYPGIQVLTVTDILRGERPRHPSSRTLSFPDPKMVKMWLAPAEQQQHLKFA